MSSDQEKRVLDNIAEYFRLPVWQIRGGAADFIDCIHGEISQVRDTSGHAADDFLEECGYSPEDYR